MASACNSSTSNNSGLSCVAGRMVNSVVWLPYLGVVFSLLIVSILCVSWHRYRQRVKKRHRMLLDYLQVDIDVRRRRICGVMRTPVHIFLPDVAPVTHGEPKVLVQHTENYSRVKTNRFSYTKQKKSIRNTHTAKSPAHSVTSAVSLGSNYVFRQNKADIKIMKQRSTRKILRSESDGNKHIFTIENTRGSMEENISSDNSLLWIDTCNSLDKTNERSNSYCYQRRKCIDSNYVNERTDSTCARTSDGRTQWLDGRRRWKNLNRKHEGRPRARDEVAARVGGRKGRVENGEEGNKRNFRKEHQLNAIRHQKPSCTYSPCQMASLDNTCNQKTNSSSEQIIRHCRIHLRGNDRVPVDQFVFSIDQRVGSWSRLSHTGACGVSSKSQPAAGFRKHVSQV